MSRMNTELFIANRLSGRSGGRRSVMVRIASAAVAVGTAVILVTLAVIGGFRKEITGRLSGFGGHVRIVSNIPGDSFTAPPIVLDPRLEAAVGKIPDFGSIHPYAIVSGVIKTPEALHGIALKGVAGDYDTAFFRSSLLRGRLPRTGGEARFKDLLVSQTVADLLRIDTADRVELMFVGGGGVRRDAYRISGVYSTGMDELDRTVTITDIRNVQRLLGWDNDLITGYEVNTRRFDRLDGFAGKVYETIFDYTSPDGTTLRSDSIEELNPAVFDWLGAHRVNAAVIIVIMLAVAALNMASALLIILLERTSMIGVLRALGMKVRSVQKIFLIRSLRIVLAGMLWGNIAGLGFVLLQRYTGVLRLDEEGYMLSRVPVDFGVWWWLALNIALPAVMVALMSLPAAIISGIKPEQTMRYQ